MNRRRNAVSGVYVMLLAVILPWPVARRFFAQRAVPRDPAEPQQGRAQPKVQARPAGAVAGKDVDEKGMRRADSSNWLRARDATLAFFLE